MYILWGQEDLRQPASMFLLQQKKVSGSGVIISPLSAKRERNKITEWTKTSRKVYVISLVDRMCCDEVKESKKCRTALVAGD